MSICAIHQPNFFPWIGYFDKIRQADYFIFLDAVAYPKSGSGSGSWCNRVKIQLAYQDHWFGLPIKKESGTQLIRDVQFANQEYQVGKLLKTLSQAYKKATHFTELMPLIQDLLTYPQQNLADYNIHAITKIAAYLGLKTTFIRQTELPHSAHSTELLIELIQAVGAKTYLCGNGAGGYQEDALFNQQGIQLQYQDLKTSPLTSNLPEGDQGFSILHCLFHHLKNGD
jgi:hypothetical protein